MRWRRATARWTSAARSRRCCARKDRPASASHDDIARAALDKLLAEENVSAWQSQKTWELLCRTSQNPVRAKFAEFIEGELRRISLLKPYEKSGEGPNHYPTKCRKRLDRAPFRCFALPKNLSKGPPNHFSYGFSRQVGE